MKLQAEVHVLCRFIGISHVITLYIKLTKIKAVLFVRFWLNLGAKWCTAKTVAHHIFPYRYCKNSCAIYFGQRHAIVTICHTFEIFNLNVYRALSFHISCSASLDNVKQQTKKKLCAWSEKKPIDKDQRTHVSGGCVVAVVHKTQTDLFAYIII